MKKIWIVFVMLFLCANATFAGVKNHTLNFNGNKYYLLYSAKNPENNGYLNEYYRNGETYNLWSEMVAIHHFPNAYSPIDRVKQFREYLGSINCPSSLTFDDKKNIAVIDFVLTHKVNSRTLLEFNIFKYEKSKKNGSNAIQYAKRYVAVNALQMDKIKQDYEKNRKKLINNILSMKLPAIVEKDIDLCKVESELLGTEKEENIVSKEEVAEKVEETKTEEVISDKTAEEVVEKTKERTEDKETIVNEEKIEPAENNNDIVEQKSNEYKAAEPQNEQEVNVDESLKEKVLEDDKNIQIKDEIKSNENINNDSEIESITQQETVQINEGKNVKEENVVENDKIKKEKKQKPEKLKKAKKEKEVTYKIVNDKSEYYSKPSKPRKVNRKKETKKRAKEAAKKLKENL